MNTNIKVTGIELTPAISDYANKKIVSIEKYLHNHDNALAMVEIGKITQHHRHGDVFRAEIHITGAGNDLYVAVEKEDLYAAIDLMKDEIIESITKGKDKNQTRSRRGAQVIKYMMKGITSGLRKFRRK